MYTGTLVSLLRSPPEAHTPSVQNADKSNSTRTFELPPLEHDFFGPCGAIISHTTINAASAGAREDHVAPTPHRRLHVAQSKLNLSQNELHHCKSRTNPHVADATPAHNNNLTTMSTSTFAKYTVTFPRSLTFRGR
jgi:hypothetical protein